MPDKRYLVYDGFLRPFDMPLLKTTNRAFRYGDAIFETMRFHKGRILFWADHYNRLLQGMAVMRFPVNGLPPSNDLWAIISNLVVKNRFFHDSRIRLTLFRGGEGLYTPEMQNASWIIEASPIADSGYTFQAKGIKIGVYESFPKQFSPISPFKSANSLPYILAGLHARENGFDECLVCNNYGKIIESTSSNIFWVKEGTLFTPLVSTGCIDGILRKQILRIAQEQGIKVIENQGAGNHDLLEADELFLTNTISGIKWVGGYNLKRYFSKMSFSLHQSLVNLAAIN